MTEHAVHIELPWPPSINHYYLRTSTRVILSTKGLMYRREACIACRDYQNIFTKDSKLFLSILAYPPDKRRRDLDNTLKCQLDALQHAGLYPDDYKIYKLHIERMPELLGKMVITIKDTA